MSEAQSLPDTIEPKVKTIRECLDEACEKFIKYCRELGHICLKAEDDKDRLINLAVILSVTAPKDVNSQKASIVSTLESLARENNVNIYGSRVLQFNSNYSFYYYCFGLH